MSRLTRSHQPQLLLTQYNFTVGDSSLKPAKNTKRNAVLPAATVNAAPLMSGPDSAEGQNDDANDKYPKRRSPIQEDGEPKQLEERSSKRLKTTDEEGEPCASNTYAHSSAVSPAKSSRARSVPPYVPAVLELDHNTNPPSPRRSSSKSRDRDTPRISPSPSLDPIHCIVTTLPSFPDLRSDIDGDTDVHMSDSAPIPLLRPLSPRTPTAHALLTVALPMSPLTPLPITPFPRMAEAYQDVVMPVEDKDDGRGRRRDRTNPTTSRSGSRATTPSRIPRPSSTSSFSALVFRSADAQSVASADEDRPPAKARLHGPASNATHGRPKTPGPSTSKTPSTRAKSLGPSLTPRVKASAPDGNKLIPAACFVASRSHGQSSTTDSHLSSSAPSPIHDSSASIKSTQEVDTGVVERQMVENDLAAPDEAPTATTKSKIEGDGESVNIGTSVPQGTSIQTEPLPQQSEPLSPARGRRRKKSTAATTVAEVPQGGRMTRSASLRQKAEIVPNEVPASNSSSSSNANPTTRARSRPPSSTAAAAVLPPPSFLRPTASSAAKTTPVTPAKTVSRSKSRPQSSIGELSRQSSAPSSSRPPNSTGAAMKPQSTLANFFATRASSQPPLPSSYPTLSRESTMSSTTTGSSGALSTLSMALERLNVPAPSRPNSSLGSYTKGQEEDEHRQGMNVDEVEGEVKYNRKGKGKAVDDSALDTKTNGSGTIPIQRSNTVAGNGISLTAPKDAKQQHLRQTKLMPPPPVPKSRVQVRGFARGGMTMGTNGTLVPSRGMFAVATLPPSMSSNNIRANGGAGGGRVVHRASRQTSLPVVEGSPVKGGGEEGREVDMNGDVHIDVGDVEDDDWIEGSKPAPSKEEPNPFAPGPSHITLDSLTSDALVPVRDTAHSSSDKAREKSSRGWKKEARRASQAHHLLSQSLSSLPQTPPRKTPASEGKGKARAASSTYPDSKSAPSAVGPGGIGARVSTRRAAAIAAAAAISPPSVDNGKSMEKEKVGSTPDGAKGSESGSKPKTLKILKHCNVFVDVRSEHGEDAGSLFVEMLTGLGARVLNGLGRSCTHIVYKNGLLSTLTRYRLLDNPKPSVVGIGWVVECVEQRTHVDETGFLIDIEGASIAGSNKRRRSMVPKHLLDSPERRTASTSSDSTQTVLDTESSPLSDGSTPKHSRSLVNLPPLERARQRQSAIFR